MKSIGILTSGGDNAGLNALIRSATHHAISKNINLVGVRRGYLGLIEGKFLPLTSRTVSGIIGTGGTFLGTARLPEWREPKVRREAIRNLNKNGIDGLVVVGGNGSLSGAYNLHKDGFPVIGIPGSIDDDVNGTEICLGVDTALNIIIEAIDRIRDCASSIQRAFVVEVMGRDSGALALMSAAACAAEVCLVPEVPSPGFDVIAKKVNGAYTAGKSHAIIVVAEGWKPGADELVKYLNSKQEETGFDVRTTVLGYTQRGGAPTYIDRYWGSRMGSAAVDALLEGESGKMVGVQKGNIALIPLSNVFGKLKPLDTKLSELYDRLN